MTSLPAEGWYVIYTRQHCEEQAVRNLIRQGFSVYLPRYSKSVRHARRTTSVLAPLFPRYVFVYLGAQNNRWRSVNGTFGVESIVSFGERPARLPDNIVESIKMREGANGCIPLADIRRFAPGDKLEIVSGPMREQIAVFLSDCPDDNKVFVLLDMLGGLVKTSVPIRHIDNIA